MDEAFVFIDSTGRAFKAARWGKEKLWWLFSWHAPSQSWYILRPIDGKYQREWRDRAVPAEEAAKYEEEES